MILTSLLGFAISVFTAQSTETAAKIGDLKLQATEDTTYHIPQFLSGGALVLGVIVIGLSLNQKRQSLICRLTASHPIFNVR